MLIQPTGNNASEGRLELNRNEILLKNIQIVCTKFYNDDNIFW